MKWFRDIKEEESAELTADGGREGEPAVGRASFSESTFRGLDLNMVPI